MNVELDDLRPGHRADVLDPERYAGRPARARSSRGSIDEARIAEIRVAQAEAEREEGLAREVVVIVEPARRLVIVDERELAGRAREGDRQAARRIRPRPSRTSATARPPSSPGYQAIRTASARRRSSRSCRRRCRRRRRRPSAPRSPRPAGSSPPAVPAAGCRTRSRAFALFDPGRDDRQARRRGPARRRLDPLRPDSSLGP
ncbi:MAG: hypothetical protein MZV64_52885 [Ignavibacteriales bacterium]|nr:hypothetical protein [Ignavibacteriales bacterium]